MEKFKVFKQISSDTVVTTAPIAGVALAHQAEGLHDCLVVADAAAERAAGNFVVAEDGLMVVTGTRRYFPGSIQTTGVRGASPDGQRLGRQMVVAHQTDCPTRQEVALQTGSDLRTRVYPGANAELGRGPSIPCDLPSSAQSMGLCARCAPARATSPRRWPSARALEPQFLLFSLRPSLVGRRCS